MIAQVFHSRRVILGVHIAHNNRGAVIYFSVFLDYIRHDRYLKLTRLIRACLIAVLFQIALIGRRLLPPKVGGGEDKYLAACLFTENRHIACLGVGIVKAALVILEFFGIQ